VRFVSFYEMAPGALAKVGEHFLQHRARVEEFRARGELIAAGPFSDPTQGAMAIFTTREAAEAFIGGDPFVTEGLVGKWRIVEWNAAL
jgi:uncharacterized protein